MARQARLSWGATQSPALSWPRVHEETVESMCFPLCSEVELLGTWIDEESLWSLLHKHLQKTLRFTVSHLLPQCPFITSFGWVASSCQALHTHTHIKILSPLPFSPSELTAAELISQNKSALKLYSLPIHHVTFWQSSISCIVVTCLWPQVEPLKRTQLHNTVTLLSLNAHKQKKNPNKTLGIVVKYPLLMAATPSMLSLAKQEALKKGESKAVGECSRVRTLEGSGRRQSSRDESADGGKGAPKHGTAEHPTHCWGSAQALPVIQL